MFFLFSIVIHHIVELKYQVGSGGTGNYFDYDIPPEALADEQFAAMMAEAEKYLGYPYVWGRRKPFHFL